MTMTYDEFFAEAKRLNVRMLGTPEETRALLDLKDAEIERLRKDAERWRHCCVHGFPIRGPQIMAFAVGGGAHVGDTLEAAVDAAMAADASNEKD